MLIGEEEKGEHEGEEDDVHGRGGQWNDEDEDNAEVMMEIGGGDGEEDAEDISDNEWKDGLQQGKGQEELEEYEKGEEEDDDDVEEEDEADEDEEEREVSTTRKRKSGQRYLRYPSHLPYAPFLSPVLQNWLIGLFRDDTCRTRRTNSR